jgi:hypothetical protein
MVLRKTRRGAFWKVRGLWLTIYFCFTL